MKYSSTRSNDQTDSQSLDEVLLRGIAEDGGLFVPDSLPAFTADNFSKSESIRATAKILLAPFFSESSLAVSIDEIIAETFHFPIPLSKLDVVDGNAWMLELYHGPTAAFKDVGAGFLAACLSRLDSGAEAPLSILVATSGDTGGAVAAAFDGKPNIRVVVLFPNGRVSKRQEKQLTCWSDNVLSLAPRMPPWPSTGNRQMIRRRQAIRHYHPSMSAAFPGASIPAHWEIVRQREYSAFHRMQQQQRLQCPLTLPRVS